MDNQTAKTLKKIGRPPGKKSDPNFRQVTVYISAELHDKSREGVKDFSELVEKLLRDHLQTAKRKKQSSVGNQVQSNVLMEMATKQEREIARAAVMSEEEFNQLPHCDDDESAARRQQEIAEYSDWAAEGLITQDECEKLIQASEAPIMNAKQSEFMMAIYRRVRT
jgi:hypothetical protein